jgi:hypothetical protein
MSDVVEELKDFITGLDFTDDDPGKDDSELEKIAKLASRQEQAEEKVKALNLDLAKAQAALAEISEKQIPELMASLGLDEVKTRDGLKVKIKSTLRASIPQEDLEKQQKAFTWLEDRGHEHLIKREIKIQFGKSEVKWANKFEADLRKRKRPLVWDRKMTVHPKTLAAFLSSELEKGTEVPMETFNAFPQKYSKIERLK